MIRSVLSCSLFFVLITVGVRAQGAGISLVNHTNTWRYRKGTSAPQSNWKTVAEGSLDASWLSGNGGIGFADNTNETSLCQTILSDMRNNYTTVAMRRTFQVTSNVDSNLHLILTMDWDDGFIAWLDGAYLTSFLSPGSPSEPAFGASASGLHESSRGNNPQPARSFDLGAVGSRLGIGTHLLAIVGLNDTAGSSDFIQIADLTATAPPTNGVSGVISANTTWRLTNSPILVVGDVTVNPGVTLTIEPGVSVLFDAGFGLTVEGRLLAEGDPTNRIIFSRSTGNTTTWAGITIPGGIGSPETRIRHAHIEFNSGTAISVPGGSVWLEHLTFGSPGDTYIEVDGASFVISDCVFPSATTKFELVHGTGGIRSDGHGVIRRNFFGLPVGYSDALDFTGGNRPGPILHIVNNVFSGATDDAVDLDGTDAWIEGNIFQHVHRRGDTPDSAAAVSGGSNSGSTSELTVIGNIFYDCDNAATAKQGNFFTLINNTIVHITNAGGIDFDSGAINVRDTTPSPTSFARGFYLEGNIIADASQLVRNYSATGTVVTLNGNILPSAWSGPGTNNLIADPMFKHVPALPETVFTNWADAQIYRNWFSLLPGSPGMGTGPNGLDKGGVIAPGASVSAAPGGTASSTNVTLTVGINRSGFGIPAGWPAGAGYVAYRYRVDGGVWSSEQAIATPISLQLPGGPHSVEVSGKRDSGLYQDDPVFGEDAVITRLMWGAEPLRITSESITGNNFSFQFRVQASETYTVQYRNALDQPWFKLTNVAAQATAGPVTVTDSGASPGPGRFYRVLTPAVQ